MRRLSEQAERYLWRNQVAITRGSNLTQEPILKQGMRLLTFFAYEGNLAKVKTDLRE